MCYEAMVSVIIPAYNAAGFVRAAITSALSQTYSNLEVIVVDDGSTDETTQIVEEIAQQNTRVRLLKQENSGVAAARNLAIAHMRGEFIAPLDSDDVWMPEKIARQVAVMQEGGRKVGLVYAWWLGTNGNGQVVDVGVQWDAEGRVSEALLYCNFIGNASVPLFRREALERVGTYNTQLLAQNAQGCEDWDISLRVAEHYEVRRVPAYLSYYRNVSGSMSKNYGVMAKSHQLVARAALARCPDVPIEVYRWSRGGLLRWLIGLSYHDGNYRESLRWGRQLVLTDPAAVLSPWVLQTLSLSALWLLALPFVGRVWPDREAYTSLKHGWFSRINREHHSRCRQKSGTEHTNLAGDMLSPTMLDATRRPVPISKPHMWSPSLWRQYDRVCLRRWERLLKLSARHA